LSYYVQLLICVNGNTYSNVINLVANLNINNTEAFEMFISLRIYTINCTVKMVTRDGSCISDLQSLDSLCPILKMVFNVHDIYYGVY